MMLSVVKEDVYLFRRPAFQENKSPQKNHHVYYIQPSNPFSTQLLSDYAYSLQTGGKLYTVTDVKELHDWEVEHLELHPFFERVPDEETKDDPCIKFMTEGTDEAKKVHRNGG